MSEAQPNESMESKCPQCGAPLPSGVLAGLCPSCLLKQGATADTGVEPEPPLFQPPETGNTLPPESTLFICKVL